MADPDESIEPDQRNGTPGVSEAAINWWWTVGVALGLTVLVTIALWPARCRTDYVVVEPVSDSAAVTTSSENVGCDSVLFTPLSYDRHGSLDDLRLRLAGIALVGGVVTLVAAAGVIRGASRWLVLETTTTEQSSDDDEAANCAHPKR